MDKKKITAEEESEQWIVDSLSNHEGHDISIEILEDEILLSCHDCQEIILNFLERGAQY